MELSDMKVFDQRVLVPCDRTGVVYWLNGKKAVPWIINADGNGSSDEKPFKAEWMTIKDEKLWVGGVGKEWTTENGSVDPLIGLNSFYIKVIHKSGFTQHLNWRINYDLLRLALGTPFPGYLVHEAIQWSDVHQKWFVLPRKHSSDPFDEVDSQIKGVNFMLVASEDFSDIKIVPLLNKTAVDTRLGFSAFQFLPGTNDQVIVALKTLEVDDSPLASYIVALDVTGNILYEEIKIDGDIKLEGIEFVDWTHLYWNR
uniref:Apyrase n=1 Tax=Ditylenchus dipsaci TaxID=166011 RepID=A0A915E285_9BILA